MKRKEDHFGSYKDWKARHLKCRYVFRDADRSTVSRVYLCGYGMVCRCMFARCPLTAR